MSRKRRFTTALPGPHPERWRIRQGDRAAEAGPRLSRSRATDRRCRAGPPEAERNARPHRRRACQAARGALGLGDQGADRHGGNRAGQNAASGGGIHQRFGRGADGGLWPDQAQSVGHQRVRRAAAGADRRAHRAAQGVRTPDPARHRQFPRPCRAGNRDHRGHGQAPGDGGRDGEDAPRLRRRVRRGASRGFIPRRPDARSVPDPQAPRAPAGFQVRTGTGA